MTQKTQNQKQEMFEKLNFNNSKNYNCSICENQKQKLIAVQTHQCSEFLEYEICINVFESDCRNKKCLWHVFCLDCWIYEFNKIFKLKSKAHERLQQENKEKE